MSLTCKLTNPEPDLSLVHTPQEAISSALIIGGLGARQLETTTIAQSPLKLFTQASSKAFTLPCLAFPSKPQ